MSFRVVELGRGNEQWFDFFDLGECEDFWLPTLEKRDGAVVIRIGVVRGLFEGDGAILRSEVKEAKIEIAYPHSEIQFAVVGVCPQQLLVVVYIFVDRGLVET